MKNGKSQCVNNIYAIAKKENIAIKKLEEIADVSYGYFARLGENTLPNIEVLQKISSHLHVSIDFLLYSDCYYMNQDQLIVLNFIHDLLIESCDKKKIWEEIRMDIIKKGKTYRLKEIIGNLFLLNNKITDHGQYFSSSFNSSPQLCCGNVLLCKKEGFYILLLQLRSQIYDNIILSHDCHHELYIIKENDVIPLCSTDELNGFESLDDQLKELYRVATENSRIFALSNDAKNVLKLISNTNK